MRQIIYKDRAIIQLLNEKKLSKTVQTPNFENKFAVIFVAVEM